MDIDSVLSKPAFSKMSPEQLSAFKSLIVKLQNKTLIESLPVLMQFMADVPKGPPLSVEEQEAMTEVLLENMNESERTKFKMIMALVKKHG